MAVKDEWMEHHDDVLGAISSLISSDLLVEHCRYETMRIYIFFWQDVTFKFSDGELRDLETAWTSE